MSRKIDHKIMFGEATMGRRMEGRTFKIHLREIARIRRKHVKMIKEL